MMKIAMLAGEGPSTTILYNALKKDFEISSIVIEKGVGKKAFLKNRAKKLGWWKVLGQMLFQAAVVPLLKREARARISHIKRTFQFNESPIDSKHVERVNSVNEAACIELLQKIQPDIVVVNGTRIISKKVLNSIPAVFINTHAGITPKYRGVHGGYWALVSKDAVNCGVTVHLVDSGIDTGGVLYQSAISPTAEDNFCTYPLLQLGEGILLMKKALQDAQRGSLSVRKSQTTESQLWYHPTAWEYFKKRVLRGIK
jgi:folate-dependent phosphoribosylglycinamide formyltransferase PurN